MGWERFGFRGIRAAPFHSRKHCSVVLVNPLVFNEVRRDYLLICRSAPRRKGIAIWIFAANAPPPDLERGDVHGHDEKLAIDVWLRRLKRAHPVP